MLIWSHWHIDLFQAMGQMMSPGVSAYRRKIFKMESWDILTFRDPPVEKDTAKTQKLRKKLRSLLFHQRQEKKEYLFKEEVTGTSEPLDATGDDKFLLRLLLISWLIFPLATSFACTSNWRWVFNPSLACSVGLHLLVSISPFWQWQFIFSRLRQGLSGSVSGRSHPSYRFAFPAASTPTTQSVFASGQDLTVKRELKGSPKRRKVKTVKGRASRLRDNTLLWGYTFPRDLFVSSF